MCICVINNNHLFGKCLIPLTEYSSLKEELRPSNLSHYWASLAWAAQSQRGGCNILPSTQLRREGDQHHSCRTGSGGFEMKYSGSNSDIYCW